MRRQTDARRRGVVAVALIVVLLLGNLIIVGVVLGGARDHDLTVQRVDTVQAFYAAEAGMNMALREMTANNDEDGDGTIGGISDDGNGGNDPGFGAAKSVVTASEDAGQTTLLSQGRGALARRWMTAVGSASGGGTSATWSLDEASGTTATEASNGNDGTYVNGVTLGGAGQVGAAPEFDGGNDYVLIPHDDSYLLDDGTVTLWFNAVDSSGRQELFSKDSMHYDTGGHLTIWLEGAIVKLRLQGIATDHYLQSGSLGVGLWHHIAFLWGADGMKLYVDGGLVDSDPYTGGLGTTSGGAGNYEPIVLGANTWASDNLTHTPLSSYFEGMIDEVSIFSRALTEPEVTDLNAGVVPGAGGFQISSWQETAPN